MKRNKQIGCVSVIFFLAFFALAASTLPAEAVSTSWKANPATPASWHDLLNWTVRVPIAGDNAYIDNGGTALITADFGTNYIYAGFSDTGHIEQSGGIGTVSSYLYLGYNSGLTGTFNQSGGTNSVSSLVMGLSSDSTGTYDLIDGQLFSNWQLLGEYGTATFTQSGGTNTVSGNITLGRLLGTGVYNLSGGSLSSPSQILGSSGSAVFNQTGGANTVSGILILGNYEGSSGTYNLSTGQLSAQSQYIGGRPTPFEVSGGTGTFIQEGGINSSQYLRVGTITTPTIASSYVFHSGQLNAKNIYVTPYGYFANSGGPGIREILVTHSFLNDSTYNEEFRLLNTTLILLGDGPNLPTTLDTNSLDMGLGLGGYDDNFALGDLIFKGSTLTQYHYKLFSDVYTLGLVIEDGAIVDLNGYTIYYIPMGGTIHLPPHYEPLSPSTFYLGGTWMNGEILPAVTIPEPATLALLALGALGVLARARRRRAH